MFYLIMHSYFVYSDIMLDIGQRTTQITRQESHYHHYIDCLFFMVQGFE